MTLLPALWTALCASRVLQVALVGLVGFSGWQIWLVAHDQKVKAKYVAAINQQSKAIAIKSGAARQAAAEPGSVDRLRARYCGDCR